MTHRTAAPTLQSPCRGPFNGYALLTTKAMFYLLVSFSVSAYSGKEQIYILKWTNTDTYIEFIPFMVMCAYMLALLSVHFIFCIITQVARQRYVNDFSKYNANPE